MTVAAELYSHYAAVRARLRAPPRAVVAAQEAPAVAPEPTIPWATPTITQIFQASDDPLQTVLLSLPPDPLIADVRLAITTTYGITNDDLIGQSRKASFAKPRQIGMTIAALATRRSLSMIARSFGRDHSTLLYALAQHQDAVSSEMDRLGIARLGKRTRLSRPMPTGRRGWLHRAVGPRWSEEDDALLRNLWPGKYAAIGAALGRSADAVRMRGRRLGLRRANA